MFLTVREMNKHIMYLKHSAFETEQQIGNLKDGESRKPLRCAYIVPKFGVLWSTQL